MNVIRKCYIPGAMFGPFSFINVSSAKEVLDDEDGMKNMVEIAVVFQIIQLLRKECARSKHKISMAVLSQHPAQVKCMQQKLENYQQNNEFFKVRVGYVDDYQHGEADVVIISTVGADEDECSEANTISNYTNVYSTWARHCLWILGDESMHMKGGSIWKCLIFEAKTKGCFFHADESKELAKAICEVKKDLHQLDELFSGESKLFQNTTWKVLFSSMFRTSFSKIESLETKKLVFLMLLKLSSGWRPKGSSTAASISKSSYFELMKEFKVKGLHLICTIDIMKETHYTQILKVWDILPFHEIAGLVTRLERIFGMYTREYIDRCKERCVQRGQEYKEFPMKWLATSEIIQYKTNANRNDEMFMDGANGTGCIENVKVRESLILMKFYSLSTRAVNAVIYGCDGGDLGIPFELTEQEKDVVSFNKSSFILGRLTCGGDSSSQSGLTHIDEIDEMMLSEDIPDQFVNLPQDVYPLIITFHRFLLMLDGTVGTSYFERFPSIRRLIYGNKTSTERLKVLEQFMRAKEVTYERFCSAYWPHFNNKLTKKLDPSTVYTEIMSVIKGGLVTDKAPDVILFNDDYVALCDGRISIFDDQKREIIYSIFLQYEIRKVENGDFDLADFVNDLHQRLEVEGYKGDIMDYVYVDEVQDLSMRQIMLFKYVCTNVHEGFAFSGDTAQAIAKGIAFRFEDIRCMFFKKFLSGSEKGNISKIFQLSENFRTHAGVLNLAQSVINLLCHFFPLFVDALRPETSQINGDLPILLETDENNNAIKFIFEGDGFCSQPITGFGAEQVVLVRDESLKEKVVNIVGKNALVLTIMESKGLEFQDVLLYDFFTTSSFSNEWRIIYKYMKDMDLLDSPFATLCSSFDMQKHAVLCTELKQLYVAITRARQRLWICESTGFSEPIYDYWKKLSLVEVKHLSGSFADNMHIPSSKPEWRSRGIKLFHENNFRMAQMCFSKAGDKHYEKLAEAYHLRAIGGDARVLKDAAELFSSIGKKVLAAECFYDIEDYETAGYIYKGESMFEKAGNCFHLARCYKLAVEEYEKARAFVKCLSACTDGQLFDIGFNRLGLWGECGGDELKSFLHKGARYYFLKKDFTNMMKFVRSFSEKDKMRSFLTKRRCFDELIFLEEEWENFKEAAKVMHKGACYYYSIKDFENMMKFVRSFSEKDKMRSFLTKRRCFDELIFLEEE
ncbi:hypothetical protein SSX86_028930 [Deinandra increscens subsp. villosa]|uniref:UvrD-like helicase ATP-binding domain-containing protein n=1 Tax=Deinandra increscens subsp. villosa TaxID=3103831 RepID=A0AAP0C915_9ASTR